MKASMRAAVTLLALAAISGCSISSPGKASSGQGQLKGTPGSNYFVNLFTPPIGGIITSSEVPTPRINCGASSLGKPVADAHGVLQYAPVYYPGADRCGQIQYQWTESVTLSATPQAGTTFFGWAGDCAGQGTCSLAAGADKTVAAAFIDATAWTLSLIKSGDATGAVTAAIPGQADSTCAASQAACDFAIPITNPASVVTLTASPAAGAQFAGWGSPCAGTGACLVEVARATAVTAAFTLGGGTTPPVAPAISVAVSPTSRALVAGQQATFAATVANSADQAVTWTVTEAGGGSIAADGTYTAPATAGTYHVIATARADATKSGSAAITVTTAPVAPVVSVAVSPRTRSVLAGQQATFSAAVANSADQVVAWSVAEAGGGSITSGGVYTAPAAPGTYHVVATAHADAGKADSATVTVSSGSCDQACQLQVLSGKAILFGHQSVGGQIIAGIGQVLAAAGAPKPTLAANARTASALGAGIFGEFGVGANTYPDGKIADFEAVLSGGAGAKLDAANGVAFMKYCFVDFYQSSNWFTAGHTVPELFALYQAMAARMQAAYPHVTLVHVTVPLTHTDLYNYGGNDVRHAYNQLLRAAYGAGGHLFDLALLESTDGSGNPVIDNYRPGVPALRPDWGLVGDDGHLNPAGQAAVSAALIQFLAGL